MDNEENLYLIISKMKQEITLVVGTVMGGGVELPPAIIDRYAHILGSDIQSHKSIIPQEIFNLLNDILALPQMATLTPRKIQTVKRIRDRFYVNYTLTQSKTTRFEARAEEIGLAPFNLGPTDITMTLAEPITGNLIQRHPTNETQNRFFANMTSMRLLPQAQTRVIPLLNVNPTFGPLTTKKSKKTRRTKSANHKSKTKTPKRRSA